VDPSLGLFRFSNGQYIIQNTDESNRKYYKLVGALLSWAFRNEVRTGIPFSINVYQYIMTNSVDLSEMKHIFPQWYRSLHSLR
jgi:hypothetical protein